MSNSNALDILISKGKERLEQTAIALADSRRTQAETEAFLQALVDYRQEYSQALSTLMRQGCPALTLSYYRDFLNSLEKAVNQAREVVSTQIKQVETVQHAWVGEHKSLNSYETLQSRRQKRTDLREKRVEQKNTDEVSSRMLTSRHSFSMDL